jgi:hypothetical protein
MTAATSSNFGGGGGTSVSARPPAPPPNPKQTAITLALELAKLRASRPGEQDLGVGQLIADATEIESYIGTSPRP